jgi:hypothetical protein
MKKRKKIVQNTNAGNILKEKKFSEIHYKEVLIRQLDLFKMWHYNNAARSTSLKALEISMNFNNVMECRIQQLER